MSDQQPEVVAEITGAMRVLRKFPRVSKTLYCYEFEVM